MKNGYVTYAALASVLAASASVYAYLAVDHASAGHARHDTQIQQLEDRVHSRMQEHIETEGAHLHLFEQSLIRQEAKQDRLIDHMGIGYPAGAPPLRDVPPNLRPDAIHLDGGHE